MAQPPHPQEQECLPSRLFLMPFMMMARKMTATKEATSMVGRFMKSHPFTYSFGRGGKEVPKEQELQLWFQH